MNGHIDRATVDKLFDAINIVDVVGEFVTLRKAGVNYKGLCPFHDDKTPSFMVSPSKQICKCFSCGEGGNAVSFLMKHEQFTYSEALHWLAKKYNIEIAETEYTEAERRQRSERESMLIVNEWAMQYFHNILKNDPKGIANGRQYFRSRGIRDDIIEKFQLGYALENNSTLLRAAKSAGYQEEFLVKTGLCIKSEHGFFDRFAGRVIFPWLNISGKVVAFGGRKLDAATKGVQQKYVNSPDSDIYHKERELYGLYQAKKAITKEDVVYLVEGYTDVISMHQCGIENTVANSGTALSIHQIKLLRRFTNNITLIYDRDEAGMHAAMRGIDLLLKEGVNVRIVLLPEGHDPDSFSKANTAQQFKEYITKHQGDFVQFKVYALVKNVSDATKRAEGINSIIQSIAYIPDDVIRASFISECSKLTHIEERTIKSQVERFKTGAHDTRRTYGNKVTSVEVMEEPSRLTGKGMSLLLIREIIRHGEIIIYPNVVQENGETTSLNVAQYIDYDLGSDNLDLGNSLYNQILSEAVNQSSDEGFVAEKYFLQHENPEINRLAASLILTAKHVEENTEQENPDSLREKIMKLILSFRMEYLDKKLSQLKSQMEGAGSNMETINKLVNEYKRIQKLRNALSKVMGR